MICNELQNIMVEYMFDLKDQLSIYHMTRNNEGNIKIKNLYDIPENIKKKLSQRLSQDIIEQPKYQYLVKLYCRNNDKIRCLNHLIYLEKLDCSGTRTILDQEGIKKLVRMKELDTGDNFGIYNVNHMKDLESLDCYWKSSVDQDGIKELKNIKYLRVSLNSRIHNVNHLTKLERLICRKGSGINQEGIKNSYNLKYLDCIKNHKIRYVDHIKKLKLLYCTRINIDYSNHPYLQEYYDTYYDEYDD